MLRAKEASGLRDFAGSYRALLCDVWGVVHDGERACEATGEALRRFREGGGVVLLLTNAPRGGEAVERALIEEYGADARGWDAILTSGDASRAALRSGEWGRRCWFLGPERDVSLFEGASMEKTSVGEADSVVCSGMLDELDGGLSYEFGLREARSRGLRMLCANPDMLVARGGRVYPCAGEVARRYEELGGEVMYYGKPHRPIYERAFEILGGLMGGEPMKGEVLAAGDGVDTDIKGARDFGLDALYIYGAGGVGLEGEDGGASAMMGRLLW